MTYHGGDTYQIGRRIAWVEFRQDTISLDGALDEEGLAEVLAEWRRWKEDPK